MMGDTFTILKRFEDTAVGYSRGTNTVGMKKSVWKEGDTGKITIAKIEIRTPFLLALAEGVIRVLAEVWRALQQLIVYAPNCAIVLPLKVRALSQFLTITAQRSRSYRFVAQFAAGLQYL